jgi:hypothetical protein
LFIPLDFIFCFHVFFVLFHFKLLGDWNPSRCSIKLGNLGPWRGREYWVAILKRNCAVEKEKGSRIEETPWLKKKRIKHWQDIHACSKNSIQERRKRIFFYNSSQQENVISSHFFPISVFRNLFTSYFGVFWFVCMSESLFLYFLSISA